MHTESWSKEKARKDKKKKRQSKSEKELLNFEFDDGQQPIFASIVTLPLLLCADDLEELAEETRLAKRMKKGKLSKGEFDRIMEEHEGAEE